MKVRIFLTFILAFATLALNAQAHAEDQAPPQVSDRMDQSEDSMVIEKLERAREVAEKGSQTYNRILVRLADVYAERARLGDMQENGKACTDCPNAEADRKKALDLYTEASGHVDPNDKAAVVLQTAHLDEILGHTKDAEALYNKVVKHPREYPAQLVGQAYTGLADIAFRQIKYKDAEKNFKKALAIKETPKRGYITYRLAWCYFHQDKLNKALSTLEGVLKSPDLLSKSDTKVKDPSFREEASRDLATFMSRGKVGPKEVQTLSELSPDAARTENLTYLASELDRLGKKGSSILVWNIVGAEHQEKSKNQMENHLRLAQLQYDLGRKDLTNAELEQSVAAFRKDSCGDADECKTLQADFKKLVTNWGKAEEKQPTPELIKAYGLYVSVFPDAEMNYWAAEASKRTKLFTQAATFYRSASTLASGERKESGKASAAAEKISRIFEGSLLGEIEVAELSKDNNLRDAAYNHYLDLDPQGDKNVEVRYQQAHILYEKAKYAEAADAFRKIALINDKNQLGLRSQAADLALDSLVLAKRNSLVESWANEFAQTFSAKRSDYAKIARRAVINEVALLINDPNAPESDLHNGMVRLTQVSVKDATVQEQTVIMKDRLILSERLKDLGEVDRAADGLLSIKGISDSDRAFATSRKEWAAEMTLNFKLAFKLSQKLTNLTREERALKLGTLAELSGLNPDSYYKEYLEMAHDHAMSQAIMAKLIKRAKNPVREFYKYQSELSRNPEVYAEIVLDIFGQTHDYGLAQSALKVRGVGATASGHTLYRFIFLRDFRAFASNIRHHGLNAASAKSLKHSLNERLQVLTSLDREMERALATGDWTLQLVTLSQGAAENFKLSSDMASLPIPRGLNSKSRKEYRRLLTEQARPYFVKAEKISEKISNLWSQDEVLTSLGEELGKSHSGVKKLLREEMNLIVRAAPANKRKSVASQVARAEDAAHKQSLSQQKIAQAQMLVKADPFSTSKLEQLKSLEAKSGNETLVAYLDARIAHLQSGVKK